MALVNYYVIPDGQKGKINHLGQRYYTSQYLVHVNSTADDAGSVCTYIPTAINDPYPTDTTCELRDKSASRVEGQLYFWVVTEEYSSEPIEAGNTTESAPGGNGQNITPSSRPWLLTMDSEPQTSLPVEDQDNVPVLNSAGQPFDPPAEVPVYTPILNFSGYKSIASDNLDNVVLYTNALNDDTIVLAGRTFPAGQLKCVKYTLVQVWENSSFWWQKNVVLHVHPEGQTWNPTKILDAGTVEKYYDGVADQLRNITDPTGAPVTTPVLLDGSGAKLAVGGTPVFLDFNFFREVDFTSIL